MTTKTDVSFTDKQVRLLILLLSIDLDAVGLDGPQQNTARSILNLMKRLNVPDVK